MSRIDDAFGISEQALVFRSRRSSVLASNIANADTPNYLARDYDFKTALRDAEQGAHMQLQTSNSAHISLDGSDEFGGLQYRIPTKEISNGNTVEGEIEQAAFSENALRYQSSLQFLSGTIHTLRLALKGE